MVITDPIGSYQLHTLFGHAQFYGEMVAGGTMGKMPQWVPYTTCDTPGGSCELQYAALGEAANKKGCLDPWLPSEPRVGASE